MAFRLQVITAYNLFDNDIDIDIVSHPIIHLSDDCNRASPLNDDHPKDGHEIDVDKGEGQSMQGRVKSRNLKRSRSTDGDGGQVRVDRGKEDSFAPVVKHQRKTSSQTVWVRSTKNKKSCARCIDKNIVCHRKKGATRTSPACYECMVQQKVCSKFVNRYKKVSKKRPKEVVDEDTSANKKTSYGRLEQQIQDLAVRMEVLQKLGERNAESLAFLVKMLQNMEKKVTKISKRQIQAESSLGNARGNFLQMENKNKSTAAARKII